MADIEVYVSSAPVRVDVSGAQGIPAVALLMKPPVANVAALPASSNSTNDGRVTNDTGNAYRWTGSAWLLVGKFVGDEGPAGPIGPVGPGGGTNIITSPTAPTDTTVIWLDPSTGMYAVYIGGGWVTTSSGEIIPDGAYINGDGAGYVNGSGAYYASI